MLRIKPTTRRLPCAAGTSYRVLRSLRLSETGCQLNAKDARLSHRPSEGHLIHNSEHGFGDGHRLRQQNRHELLRLSFCLRSDIHPHRRDDGEALKRPGCFLTCKPFKEIPRQAICNGAPPHRLSS